ncbi:MAG: DNA-processing protein DprA [SAR324 cluster bacterium]|nr:DNA-processing protein DprA [SAR324 cluster bacterium]
MTPSEENWLALALVKGVGQKIVHALLWKFKDATGILDASPKQLTGIRGISPEIASRIGNARTGQAFEIEKRLVEQHGIRLIPLDAEDYPPRLKETDVPPVLLYCKGELPREQATHLAVVGTRRSSRYGEKAVGRLIEGLANIDSSLVIVSGLARGIDTAAHRQALSSGLRTIAVMGRGLADVYPKENTGLAEEISGQGALISEFPMTMSPLANNFPIRNRIISGLCWGVLVAEAGDKSGALISAGFALNHNRELFAVPGNIDLPSFEGSNRLIQSGQAKLVRDAEDILEELSNFQRAAPRKLGSSPAKKWRLAGEFPPDGDKARVMEILERGALHPDELSQESKLPMEKLLGLLLELELAGEVYQTMDNEYAIS